MTHLLLKQHSSFNSVFLRGQAIRENSGGLEYIVKVEPLAIVQSTISMRSMLMLGGSGGMPPRKILKNRYSEIESGGISESIYYITFRVKLTVKRRAMAALQVIYRLL